jgi:hypothetical protein
MPLRLALLLTLLLAAPANAAVTGAAADDPTGDSTAGPGTDAVHGSWSFDDTAGRLTVAVTFAATPAGEDWGVVNATLRPACDADPFATLRGSGLPGDASASVGTAADGQQPDGSTGASVASATNVKSDDGRTTTMEVTHARLVGRAGRCLQVTISHNGVLDAMTLPSTSTVGPVYVLPGTGPAQSGPPVSAGSPGSVRLATGRKLKFSKNRATVALIGVAKGMTGRLRLALKNGTTLATGKYTAPAAQPITVRLTLTAKGRRYARKHKKFKATLTVRSTLGTTVERRYAMRVA